MQTPPGVPDLIGALGLPGGLMALIWAAYGGMKIADWAKGRKNGNGSAILDTEPLRKQIEAAFKNLEQHQDLTLTESFDQLRRDLTTTIERQHQASRDDTRNALGTFMLEQQLERLRGEDKR